MNADEKKAALLKKYERLRTLANRAAAARDRFELALDRATKSKSWKAMCEAAKINPHSSSGDWLC